MKALTIKELLSLAGILVAAPVLALGLLVSARAMAVAEHDLLLLALALCGAVVSGINGFGRRTARTNTQSDSSRKGTQSSVALHS
jgi:hypothetical protein